MLLPSVQISEKIQCLPSAVPEGDVSIAAAGISARDKDVTRFKETIITAWRGECTLAGWPEYLTFLYYTGLRVKNSEGFGKLEQ